jgi:hypothetical protein
MLYFPLFILYLFALKSGKENYASNSCDEFVQALTFGIPDPSCPRQPGHILVTYFTYVLEEVASKVGRVTAYRCLNFRWFDFAEH